MPEMLMFPFEAESVAYTVCQHYGLDTSDYSFGYVAGWSSGRELSELKSSLETIRSAAAEIINSIDENLAELQKAQDKEQTAGQEQPTREEKAAPKEQPQPETPSKADTAGKEKPEPEAAAPGKSGAQEKAGTAPKEAFTPETIYRVRRNPYSDSRENSYLLQAYVTQENGRAKMGDVLYTGTPEKCRELMGQLKSGELTEGDVKQLYAKAQETAQTAGQDKDTFSIYQIKGGDETRDFRFEPYDRLQAAGNVVDRANYELVYSAPLAPETSLEDIYTCFNIDHPKDFKGHSLSVSDVVVLHQNGQDTAHYVDSIGYRQTPEFLQPQNYLKHVEDIVEQNDNNFDGIINNTPQTPTVGELEQKVKAGEPISLIDLANAIHADKERGKEEKPSIRAQLRAAKEQTAQRKAQRSKTQDLERN